jgi:hypothetical protein
MKLPFLASFIIFIIVLTHRIHWQRNKAAEKEKSFWDREQAANSVRRKPLDNLDYIHIPMDTLPTGLMNDNDTVSDCLNILNELSTQQIVNFTGYTNTDLKLEYGTANIALLSAYDQNYTLLVTTLQKWADILWKSGYKKEAADIMEFAVNTHTDVSRTYKMLAEYYNENGQHEKIQTLLDTASTLRSVSKDFIVRTLQESYQ